MYRRFLIQKAFKFKKIGIVNEVKIFKNRDQRIIICRCNVKYCIFNTFCRNFNKHLIVTSNNVLSNDF